MVKIVSGFDVEQEHIQELLRDIAYDVEEHEAFLQGFDVEASVEEPDEPVNFTVSVTFHGGVDAYSVNRIKDGDFM